jgi:hypothetical protein
MKTTAKPWWTDGAMIRRELREIRNDDLPIAVAQLSRVCEVLLDRVEALEAERDAAEDALLDTTVLSELDGDEGEESYIERARRLP